MKKTFLLLLVFALCALTSSAQQANIYASGLKAGAAANAQVEISYVLNTDATAVAVNFVNGSQTVATVPVTEAALLTKGAHTATISLATVPAGTYSWSVSATAAANTTPVKVSGSDSKFRFYFPTGLAVDNSFESPAFGRIYVAEGAGSYLEGDGAAAYWPDGRISHDGIYIFTPTFDAVNTEAYTGNVAWDVSGLTFSGPGTSPGRLSIDDAGKVYIADNSITNSGIYVIDPAHPENDFSALFAAGAWDATGILSVNETQIHGRIPALYVEGSGANTNLYYLDRNYLPAGQDARAYLPSGMIFKYNNLTAPIASQPALVYDNPTSALANDAMGLVTDGRGGYWVSQNRAADAAAIPSLSHINAAGVADYKSADGENVNLGNSARGALAINAEKNLLAVASDKTVKILSIAYDESTGVPTLTEVSYSASVGTIGTNVDGLAFDVAGNLYAVSASPEYLYVYALPKADNTFTTPAPAAATITVGSTDPNAPLSGDYYVPNDPGNGKKWYASLAEAFTAINERTIGGNVNLYINGDITSTVNVGLINNTEYAITIQPVFGSDESADAIRTITFDKATDNAGPSGALCLGIGMGLSWNDVVPAKNITIDGSVNGAPDRRLKITTAATQNGLNGPILILDECSDITIQNAILEHVGAATGSSNYAVYLRANTTSATGTHKMPYDISILNNEIINTTAGAASQGIAAYANAEPVAPSTGVVIKDNIIRTRTRGIFLNYITDIEINGNEFYMNQSSGGLSSAAIFGNSGINGDIKVTGNYFVELKSANINAGDYGMKAIITGGAASTWYIDNNYFTGFDKTSATAGSTMLQGIRLGALAGSYIRHNTFYLNAVSNIPSNVATPTAADGSYCAINIAAGTPVIQNNLFVSDEDAFPNFFIRGNAPEATDNNIFSLQAGEVNAKIATGTIPADLKTVSSVTFEDAAAGILDLSGASNKDKNLGVAPLAGVPTDIYGTLRSTTLTYAGAFEGDEFDPSSIATVIADDIRIATGNESIRLLTDGVKVKSYILYSVTGTRILNGTAATGNVEIPISRLNAGVYLIQITTDKGTVVKRFIKK